MLQEVLLCLSGVPSPLLRPDAAFPPASSSTTPDFITPPERELLRKVAHIGNLHLNLINATTQLTGAFTFLTDANPEGAGRAKPHSSAICRAVAHAISDTYLAAFRKKVIDVEASILTGDAGLVGAYGIVPLTAVVGEFEGWKRRLEWLWKAVEHLQRDITTGAGIIDWLRQEVQTGYRDVEEVARALSKVAEALWVRQVTAWVLFGQLPGIGDRSFFVRTQDEAEAGSQYTIDPEPLPGFVTPAAAKSMLVLGQDLQRNKSQIAQRVMTKTSQLQMLSALPLPIVSLDFSRVISNIRRQYSTTVLRKLLPTPKILELALLLRNFFLLGRGEFATILAEQADAVKKSRWRQAAHTPPVTKRPLAGVVVTDGEVASVLSKTWAAMSSYQGQHAQEDEELERARGLVKLIKVKDDSPEVSRSPFQTILFSIPVCLELRIGPPFDIFLTQSDVITYSKIHSYLQSIRRAHGQLKNLWKVSSMRRHLPSPPQPPYKRGRSEAVAMRHIQTRRTTAMRSAWTTCSAAIFFLAELEGYLQGEVIATLWAGFQKWLMADCGENREVSQPSQTQEGESDDDDSEDEEQDDMWISLEDRQAQHRDAPPIGDDTIPSLDPHIISIAHRAYLSTLVRGVLLEHSSFTKSIFSLLHLIDQIVALLHRLAGIWNAADLGDDIGIDDPSAEYEAEEMSIKSELVAIETKIKLNIEALLEILREIAADPDDTVMSDSNDEDEEEDLEFGRRYERYTPASIGRVDRLLVKLDFGTWFDTSAGA